MQKHFSFLIHLYEVSLSFFSSLEEDPLYIAYADMMAKVTHSPPWLDRLLMCETLQVPVFCFRAVLKVKKRRKERRRHSR